MAKTRTSKKRNVLRKNSKTKLHIFEPSKDLGDPKKVLQTLVWCLENNELEGFRDVLSSFLRMTKNKSQLARSAGMGRRTLYDLIDREPFNPTLKTIAPILKAIKEVA